MITLPDTLQEVFNKVAIHLLTQKKKSVSATDGTCHYRGDGGLKCAAGILIPDDQYSSNMENKSWGSIICHKFVEDKFANQIQCLQNIHDVAPVSDWENDLVLFAMKNGLTFPELPDTIEPLGQS